MQPIGRRGWARARRIAGLLAFSRMPDSDASSSAARPAPQGLQAWRSVLALSLAAFIFNTSEFVPVGLLSGMGASFAMTPAQVGVMLTIYAWVVALAALPGMLLTRKVERRKLLMGVFTLFVVSHVLSGLAWSFSVLVLSRIGVALAHAVFWSITAALVLRVAPPGRSAQALSLLATGTAMAMVLGIPLGRMLGQALDWRTTLWAIGIVAALVMLGLARWLPRLPSENAGSLASLPALLRRPMLLAIYALMVVAITGQFTGYSYIEPFVQTVAGLEASVTTVVLLVFGGAGLLGSAIFSRWGMRRPQAFLVGSLVVLGASLAALLPASSHPMALYVVALVWGAAMIGFALAIQAQTLRLAPDATDVAMSLFSGIFNLGIGAGALLGSQVAQHGGLAFTGWVGSALVLLGAVWIAWAGQRWGRRPAIAV